ncbi:MAG: TonB family protein [Opitutae bacterium]|nr:TonB family protein [Opitutae bacterium]
MFSGGAGSIIPAMKRFTLLLGVALLAGSATAVVSATENESTMQALQLTKMVQPNFPSQMTTVGIPSGDVTLAISRDAAGVPTDVLIIESTHSLFSEAALEAVRQWRFAPSDEAAVRQAPPAIVRVRFSYQGVIVVDPTIATQRLNTASGVQARSVTLPLLHALEAAPQPVNYTEPEYPAALASRGESGEARVAFYVDADGRVRMPHVLSASQPEFGAAAVAAVAHWRFPPPKRNGTPVIATDSWRFAFKRNS